MVDGMSGWLVCVFAQMELTDTYRCTDNIKLNVNTPGHKGKKHVTEE